jgi:3-oxo-5-alpha-steroid 4-dehydrogenase 3
VRRAAAARRSPPPLAAAAPARSPRPRCTSNRAAVLLAAARGKLVDSAPRGALGPLSAWTVPQRRFADFYALGAAWNAAVTALLFGSAAFAALPPAARATHAALAAALQAHLLRRLAETLLLLRYPPGARMHGIAYLFGLSYYLALPLTFFPRSSLGSVAAAAAALARRGRLPAPPAAAARALAAAPGAALAALAPAQRAGLLLFLVGSALQAHSHALLARLGREPARARGGRAAASTSSTAAYRIPRGGAFELVSCPHYLGEILLYLGLALAASGTDGGAGAGAGPALAAAWVAANLALGARATHVWYRRRLRGYPRARRALVPWLF